MVTETEPPAHQSDSNASFLRAARAGNLDKVLEYLKGSIDINTSNANGLNALHLASKEGHVQVVLELVKRGANVNSATKKGNTALHIASLAGQEDVVKILIRNGANTNVQSHNGFTPLYMAAQENHDAVVKFLLANNANQSLATEDGFTPLAVALQQGHDKVVAVLLENDAKGRVRLPALHIAAKKDDCKAAALLLQNDHDPDVTSKSGFTPLHIAAHYGNENIGMLLLEKNADVNYSAKHQITPLHVAAKWGKSNMVTLLIDKGAKNDASTRDGLTPLHCAARSGHDQVVDLLLEKGAPITAKTKNGLAPLHMASQGDHVDSARILLYHKAPVDDVTVDYLTALHVAAHCGHVRVAKLLLDRKADPNARALNGFTPLHIACKKNRIKVVELLLKHGASIEATTESGLTPLHVASFMGCMNIVIYLIQHGANPDVPTVRGETPLHLAARANQSDIIRILLRNGAHVDASAREQQTPLHIAARLGNVDIVGLLLQHGAAVDAPTKDMYTALHIAAKEGQEEVASVLLDHGASLTATTKKGFTPLHLAAKYGNIKVARLLLQKDAPVDAQGKNGVTPLHVAAHYDHVNVALLLLDKGAFPHATAKNGYTPLHIASKKNQMDIATTLLEYGAKPSAESKAGFTPLHLAAQEGHTDMTTLLIEHHADVNAPAKNGLSPLHLCAQEDKVNVASILVKNGAAIDPHTKAGYTPLHVASHFGQINMVRFLLQQSADVNATTSHGYTPLHQAAQQGHTLIVNLLLEHKASPNTTTNQGQTALSIAQRLGYISVVETLKIVTETVVTTTTTTITEEKYKVVAPETMQETFMSDSEDEGGDDIEDTSLYGKPAHATHVYLPYIEGQKLLMTEDTMLGDQSFRYLTADEMKSLGDDSLPIDVTRDERGVDTNLIAPLTAEEDHLTPQHIVHQEAPFSTTIATDNVDLARAPIHAGFLVSFMVDARGGAMRGCRHSGVRVIIPPRKAPMPMRITCRYLRKEKLAYPPPLMEGEACASRILEVGPSGAKFLGPVIIEVPHFASLRGREREITILRSDNGESWREHTLEASDDAVHDVFNESFEGEELTALEDLSTNRITRILTTDFPQYFAIITRIRQEVHAIGPEGGMVSSTVVPQVQAIFPEGALTKKIKVGLQAQPITPELVTKLLGNRVAVSPIVTVEPRRRKFHKPITLTIPVPQAATKGMINQYSGDAPTLRLLCSITGSTKTGGTTKAQWEDVTGSTPLTFVNDCVSFTTTVSARFWLMDCRQVNEATKFATELCREAIHVPFMAEFVVFAKRHDPMEAQLRVFCMTDDKEDKTLESQEHFTEVAKSRDVEVLEAKPQYLEFAGNLVPVTKSGEQLSLTFQAFRENRLPFTIRVKDPHQEPMGRVAFMREPRVGRGEPPQSPICNLNIALPEADLTPVSELVTLERKYGFVQETSLAKPELIHRADLRLSDIAKELGDDWISLALQLDLPESDINSIRSENPNDTTQQALVMLRHWMQRTTSKATGNTLEKGLRKINREDIVNHCMFNVELVTDDVEKAVAKVHLDQSGFDTFKEELGSSRDASLRRETSLNGVFDEQDIMKDAESAAETSSESSDKEAHYRSERKAVLDDAPETLIQQIPPTFSRHLSNGQVSDLSVHEEDKSEPTAATLSSEATAEMEVSSLDDKSQGETHIEKKDISRHTQEINNIRSEAYKLLLKEHVIPRYIRKIRRTKEGDKKIPDDAKMKNTNPSMVFRKKKLIIRRNSWPPYTPPKLNKKKKYQQHLKNRNIKEPFWIDTYEWLLMKTAPESLKSAPLAHLIEFDELNLVKQNKPLFVPYVSSMEKSLLIDSFNNKTKDLSLQKNKFSDIIRFYFISKYGKKLYVDEKKHLKKLNHKCLKENLLSMQIPKLKPTNFNEISSGINITNNVENDFYEYRENIILPNLNANIKENEIHHPYINENDVPLINNFQETYIADEEYHHRSLRPLQTSDNVVSGIPHVIYRDIDLNSIKQKVSINDEFYDKENITDRFPFTKFLERHEKFKKPIIQNYSNNNRRGYTTMPKSLPFKHIPNKEPTSEPQDMPNPNKPDSQSDTSCKEKSTTNQSISSKNSSKAEHSKNPSECTISTEGSPSSHLDSFKQSSHDDVSLTISKDFSKHKEDEKRKDNKKVNEQTDESNKEVKDSASLEVNVNLNQGITKDKVSANEAKEPSNLIPATILGQAFLKSLIEQNPEIDESIKEKPFPASAIGQTFLKTLIEQQSKMPTSPIHDPSLKESNEEAISQRYSDASEATTILGESFLKILEEEQKKVEENSNPQQVFPAAVIGQSFIKTLINQTKIQEENPQKLIPSNVVGQSFLKSLIENQKSTEDNSGIQKPIPGAVVGQTFLKSLIEEQKGTVEGQKSVEVDTDPHKTIPATVIGQAFLKSLNEEQKYVQASPDIQNPIPATIIGQSFLKSLIEEQKRSEFQKTIPESVIGETGLKSLIEEQTCTKKNCDPQKSIPASVIGQSFLKLLIEEQKNPEQGLDFQKTIPATVIGQTFLKSLIQEQKDAEEKTDTRKITPAAVISHSFLKTLIEEQKAAEAISDTHKAIPANVIGQAFLKSLIEEKRLIQESHDSQKAIPAAVIGQSFLKSLIEEQKIAEETSDSSKSIPANVIGQIFLKSLIEQQKCEEENDSEKVIPASVISQSFLKSLIEEQKSEGKSPDPQTIPATVIGQSFLKSLIEEQKITEETSASIKSIPSNVIGQIFLKSLMEQQKSEEKYDSEKAITASVISQSFLKSLIEQQKIEENNSDPQSIPAAVIGQTFLKSLIEEQKSDIKSQEVPATVISHSFLKSLNEKEKISEDPLIPATVIGQAFLKSLIVKQEHSQPNKPIPATILGQSFLKSLVDECKSTESDSDCKTDIPASVIGQSSIEGQESSEKSFPQTGANINSSTSDCSPTTSCTDQVEKENNNAEPLPAAVIGQSFLKTLLTYKYDDIGGKPTTFNNDEVLKTSNIDQNQNQSIMSSEEINKSRKPIPSQVIGHSFIKSLIETTPQSSSTKETIPATVVGQAFLKTLNKHIQGEFLQTSDAKCKETLDEQLIPASVIGQAFLKNLVANQEISNVSSNFPTKPLEEKLICDKSSQQAENDADQIKSNLSSDKDESLPKCDELDVIIPPPPQFSSLSDEACSLNLSQAKDSSAEEATNIIGELLTCTKLMQTVIGNLADPSTSSSNENEQKKDI